MPCLYLSTWIWKLDQEECSETEAFSDLISKTCSDGREHILIPPRPRINEKVRRSRETTHQIDKSVRGNPLRRSK